MTPLMNGADNGSAEIIRLLLDNGTNINNKDDYGDTVLHRAGRWGKDEVNLLLKRGAHLHPKNYDNCTLLDVVINPPLLPSSRRP